MAAMRATAETVNSKTEVNFELPNIPLITGSNFAKKKIKSRPWKQIIKRMSDGRIEEWKERGKRNGGQSG